MAAGHLSASKAPASLFMRGKFSLTERLAHEQGLIRKEIQSRLDEMSDILNNRLDDSDINMAAMLHDLDASLNTARGACMRLKECKKLTALAEYMVEENQITQNEYGTVSDDDRSNKKQARRD